MNKRFLILLSGFGGTLALIVVALLRGGSESVVLDFTAYAALMAFLVWLWRRAN